MIQELYKQEKKMGDGGDLSSVYMHDTLCESNYYMHAQSNNSNGAVFGGFLMNNAVSSSYLSVQQLIEDTLESYGEMKEAETISGYFDMHSMDTVYFKKPVYIGEIVHFKSRVTFADPKSGLVRVKVTAGTRADLGDTNIFNFTYKINPKICELLTEQQPFKTLSIMPKNYSESLEYLQARRIIKAL